MFLFCEISIKKVTVSTNMSDIASTKVKFFSGSSSNFRFEGPENVLGTEQNLSRITVRAEFRAK